MLRLLLYYNKCNIIRRFYILEIGELSEIPEELPLSGRFGSEMLFELKRRAEFINEIMPRKKRFVNELNYLTAQISAIVWAINYIVESEEKIKNARIIFDDALVYNKQEIQTIPEIPKKMDIKFKRRLKRLKQKAEYLQPLINRKKSEGKKTERLENDLKVLIWVINHILTLNKLTNR